jgi:hypothetical protein
MVVSPGGRVAYVTSDGGALAVYARSETSGGDCSYQLDATYGQGGTVTVPAGDTIAKWTFDAQDRLYIVTDVSANPAPQGPVSGALYRATPGSQAMPSCRYPSFETDVIGTGSPEHITALPDGTRVFLWWGPDNPNYGEWALDTSSPSFSPQGTTCDLTQRDPTGPTYGSALSIDPSGALFLRTLDNSRIRAAATDLSLVPQRYFGGSPSGRGEQGFGDVGQLARCSAGFCAGSDRKLKVFDKQGTFLQMIDLGTELGAASVQPRSLVAVPDGSAAYMGASLTAVVGGSGNAERVYKLAALGM